MHAAEAIISTEGCLIIYSLMLLKVLHSKKQGYLLQPRIQPKLFFFQVQSGRTDPACVAQKHPTLHHSLEKRRFDSCFLSQLDGSYLFFLFLFKTKTTITGNIWRDGTKPEWPALLPVLKGAFTSACLSVYLLNQRAQCVTGVWRNR